MTTEFEVRNIRVGAGTPLVLIAGPCVVESRDLVFQTAEALSAITQKLGMPLIFKSSYRKANRTSLGGFTSIGMEEALRILSDVRKEFNLPVITDVHTVEEIRTVRSHVDALQIPAFLCRQTDLLIEAGSSNLPVNIKKGQFLAPEDMKHAAEKVGSTGNQKIMLCERGTSFGYHNLVVDMRSLVIMRSLGYPVVLDATHSVQLPSVATISGGQPEFIFPLARAGAAVGIDALFIETHPDPTNAWSDAASQLPLSQIEALLMQVTSIDRAQKNFASH